MAYNAGSVVAKLKANVAGMKKGISSAKKELNGLSKTAKSAASSIKRAGAVATAALVGIGTAGTYLIKAASDAEELQNVINQSFGDMADDINDWAEETAEAVNRSDYQIKQFVGTSMSMFKNMVDNEEQAVKMSKAITQLSADLASFRNISDDRAFEALTGALTGQAEALKRLGFNVQEAALEQYRLNQGIEKSVREMTEAEKVSLRYNVIMDKMTDIQGDAVRTRDELANSWRGFWGEVRNAREELGEYLLPIATKVVNKGREMVKVFNDLPDAIHQNIVQIGLFATGLLSAIVGLAGLVIGIEAVIGVLSVVASAFVSLTNPVTIVIALAYTFYSAWKQNLWGVRDDLEQLWNNFEEWYNNVIKGSNETANHFFESFKSAFEAVWGVLKWLINRNLDYYIVIGNIAQMSYEVIADNWDKIWKFVKGVLDKIVKKIKKVAKFLNITFENISTKVEEEINKKQDEGGFLGQIFEGVGEDHVANIGESLDNAVQIARKKAPEIAGEIKKWSEEAKKGMGELWEAMKQTAKDTFDEILVLVKKRAPELYEQIKKIVDAFKVEVDVGVNSESSNSDSEGDGGPDKNKEEKELHWFAQSLKAITGETKKAKEKLKKLKSEISETFSTAVAKGESFQDTVVNMFDNLLDRLAAKILEKKIFDPIINSVMGSIADSGDGGFIGDIFSAFTAHDGGLVTATGILESYHSGGLVGGGLAQDERIIKAQTGELVMSREDTKKFLNGQGQSGETYNINIQAVDAKSFRDLAARNPEAITNVVNNDIAKNGDTRKTIKKNL